MIKTKILIDNMFFYVPENHMFISYDSEEKMATLAIPASLCLKLLIDNRGRITSVKELLEYSWGSRGANVSPQTLYQNISILRKAIDKIGGNSKIIKTIPKRGFIIDDNVEITYIETDVLSSDLQCHSYSVLEDTSVPGKNNLDDSNKTCRKKPLRMPLFLYVSSIFLFCAFMSFGVFREWQSEADNIFINYHEYRTLDKCMVYKNKEMLNDDLFNSFISSKKINCDKRHYWYVTNYPPSTNLSIIMCGHPLTGSSASDCISIYSVDERNENVN